MEYTTWITGQALFAIACAYIAEQRGGVALSWFILGAVLGPIAFAVALTAGKRCPHCDTMVSKKATVCRHCTREL